MEGSRIENSITLTPKKETQYSCCSILSHGNEHAAFRRRFSNVGDAARKLSTSIGWGGKSVGGTPPEEIIAVGRALCSLYIRARLKRAGVFNRKLGLTRVRSALGSMEACGELVRDIFPGLSCACTELERMEPKLYTGIARQTGRPRGTGIGGVLHDIGEQLLKMEPTWGKIISIYCIAGGLALDSVRQGHVEYLHIIQDDLTELFEDRIALWIHTNGGWNAFAAHCRVQHEEVSPLEYGALFGFVAAILLAIYFLVKFCMRLGV
ncbi:hypothetical protein JTB14_033526 [Gonioctena quinquepunctata]|nr:hypothetical protein JTB14_033526 [Gonioctena quinquepunctata]